MSYPDRKYINALHQCGQGINGLIRVIEHLGFEKFMQIYKGDICERPDESAQPNAKAFELLDKINNF